MAKVFNIHELACEVINLLADKDMPVATAFDVLGSAYGYIEAQKVTDTRALKLPQKAEDQSEQQNVLTTKISVDLTDVVRKEIEKIIDNELHQVNHSPELKLDKTTGLYELKTEHS